MRVLNVNLFLILFFMGATFIACEDTADSIVDEVPEGTEWNANLLGTNTSISGEGEVISLDNEFAATVTIRAAEPDAVHPWHVHEGTCDNDMGIVGPPDSYPPLEVNENGEAEATVTILDWGLSEDLDYFINVHMAEEDLGTIVACGNLTPEITDDDDEDDDFGDDNDDEVF
ncbi:MAG: hypothetical protein WD267_06125 [Balneolales bacterium]